MSKCLLIVRVNNRNRRSSRVLGCLCNRFQGIDYTGRFIAEYIVVFRKMLSFFEWKYIGTVFYIFVYFE